MKLIEIVKYQFNIIFFKFMNYQIHLHNGSLAQWHKTCLLHTNIWFIHINQSVTGQQQLEHHWW